MKIVGMVLCVFSTSLIGLFYSGKLYERYGLLRQIEDMVTLIKNEIEYNRAGISEVSFYVSNKTTGKLKNMLLELSERTKENIGILEDIWCECVRKHLSNTSLNKNDISELCRLGKNMGYLGFEMQKVNFSNYLSLISKEICYTKENLEKTAKFYRLMGLMSGIGISILFI